MGGFETDTIPDYINLRDTVFFPVMETLGVLIAGRPVPLRHHARLRRGARPRHRRAAAHDLLTPGQIVAGKFAVTFVFVVLMMAVSFVYPAMAIGAGGLGLQHLLAVYLGLTLLGIGARLDRPGVLGLHLEPARGGGSTAGRSPSCSTTSAGVGFLS